VKIPVSSLLFEFKTIQVSEILKEKKITALLYIYHGVFKLIMAFFFFKHSKFFELIGRDLFLKSEQKFK